MNNFDDTGLAQAIHKYKATRERRRRMLENLPVEMEPPLKNEIVVVERPKWSAAVFIRNLMP